MSTRFSKSSTDCADTALAANSPTANVDLASAPPMGAKPEPGLRHLVARSRTRAIKKPATGSAAKRHSVSTRVAGTSNPANDRSILDLHPDAPALSPQALARLERDFMAADLENLLKPARSVAEVFQQPVPRLYSIDQDQHCEKSDFSQSSSASDDTVFPAAPHNGNGPRPSSALDDLFRDTRQPDDDNRQLLEKSEQITRIVEPAFAVAKEQYEGDAIADRQPRIITTGDRKKLTTRIVHRIELPHASTGTERHITVFEYGQAGVGVKAYLHAGLNANERTGALVLNHLMRRLDEADRKGNICGHCIIVPIANPIGASQYIQGQIVGEYDLDSGEKFNQNYPELIDRVADLAIQHLRGDPEYDKLIVRGALRATLARMSPQRPLDSMRHRLLSLACDADLVIDLHCQRDAVLHMYMGEALWPNASDLHRQLGSRATLLTHNNTLNPFDEAIASVWWQLSERLQHLQLAEPACLAATVKLNGNSEHADGQANRDADSLYRFLQRRGVIRGEAGPLPQPSCHPTPANGVNIIRANAAGAVTFCRRSGDFVRNNDTVAMIVDAASTSPGDTRTAVRAQCSGVLFSRTQQRIARHGDVLAHIAGATPAPDSQL